jgi:hypothetical protein
MASKTKGQNQETLNKILQQDACRREQETQYQYQARRIADRLSQANCWEILTMNLKNIQLIFSTQHSLRSRSLRDIYN